MALPPFDAGGVKLTVAWELPAVTPVMVGVPGAVIKAAPGELGVGVIGCAAGVAGGHARTLLSPLKLFTAGSTKDRIRFWSFVNRLAVKCVSLKLPEGTPAPANKTLAAWVRGSTPSNGNGSSGCGVASQPPGRQPLGLSRRTRFHVMPEKAVGLPSRPALISPRAGTLMAAPSPIPIGNRYCPLVAGLPRRPMVCRFGLATLVPVRSWTSWGVGLMTEKLSSSPPTGHSPVPKRASAWSCGHG